ncbi:capsular associated protein [Serendipita sp. 407]|nr:capsular associated protein [Serendipita sp. 407]
MSSPTLTSRPTNFWNRLQTKVREGTKVLRAIPASVGLILGIILGLFVSQWIFQTPSAVPSWIQTTHTYRPHQTSGRISIPLPSLEKRHRVYQLLTSLSPHHTKQCTRDAQRVYAMQALDRYASLVGYQPPSTSLWEFIRLPASDLHEKERSARRQHILSSLQASSDRPHKYFFAINLYNSFDVIPDIFSTLFRVAAILGYNNIFVSIYENGSKDQTKALLHIYDALLRSVGIRVVITTSQRERGAFSHRIEYLAQVRNAALVPLHELRDREGEFFDTIVFMNDILPCVDDVLELIWQSRRQNAGVTCAADYMFHHEMGSPVFYDNWVARDINGTALENAPFEGIFHHKDSSERFQRHLPIQVQSCWNGIAILDPAPIYSTPHVRFRMAKLSDKECSASECSLVCNDYWRAGYGRIIMVPRVKLAYDKKVFDIIHPARRNLTTIRGFVKLGGYEDDPRNDPQDRAWFGPHDRLFVPEEGEPIDFRPGPKYVWCWGWDGAGELDGPDVEPIWEGMEDRTTLKSAVKVRHDRSMRMV